jgi:hypothetical protein
MPALTASDFDVANVLTNVGLAGAAILAVVITTYGWRKITAFFGR